MDNWCPFATRAPVSGHESGAGAFTGGAPKICHHTTEGSSYSGAFGAYTASGNLPHFTDSFESGHYQVWQHLPLNVAATALRHPPGTGETNHDNVIQIEHVGFTASSASLAPGYLDGIAILCRWIELQTGCMRVSGADFHPGARRLSWPEWHGVSGHVGHMHCPFNDHVDPGAIDIGHILTAGQPTPAPTPVNAVDYPEDQLRSTDTRITFDGNGSGYVDDGDVPDARAVVNVVFNVQDPPSQGYTPIPVWGRRQEGGLTRIVVEHGPPSGAIAATVWIATG